MEVEFFDESEFRAWMRKLHPAAQRRVLILLDALGASPLPLGMPQGRFLGDGLHQLRVGTGHRIYYVHQAGTARIVTHGDKGSQQRDIQRARNRR